MENESKLEEIFWKEGRFVDTKNKEVKAEAIDEPRTINISLLIRGSTKKMKLERINRESSLISKANAYCEGLSPSGPYSTSFSIQFYRI